MNERHQDTFHLFLLSFSEVLQFSGRLHMSEKFSSWTLKPQNKQTTKQFIISIRIYIFCFFESC